MADPRPHLVPVDLERLRRNMRIKLIVTPTHVFRGLWEPRGHLKETYRDRLIAKLTEGWESAGFMEPERDPLGRIVYEEG